MAAHLGETREGRSRARRPRGPTGGRPPRLQEAERRQRSRRRHRLCPARARRRPARGHLSRPPRPHRPSAAPHIRVPRRRTHLPGAPPPPAPGSGCAVSSPDHHDRTAALPPSCLPQSPPACPTRRYTSKPPIATARSSTATAPTDGARARRRRGRARACARARLPCRPPGSPHSAPRAAGANPRPRKRPLQPYGTGGAEREREAALLPSSLRLPTRQQRCKVAVQLFFAAAGGPRNREPRQTLTREPTTCPDLHSPHWRDPSVPGCPCWPPLRSFPNSVL